MKKGSYKSTPPIRKPKVYLMNNRICCRCGSNKTDDRLINHVLWHRDNDEQGKWTGRWKCDKCYHIEYSRKRVQEAKLARQKFIEERNSNFKKFENENEDEKGNEKGNEKGKTEYIEEKITL